MIVIDLFRLCVLFEIACIPDAVAIAIYECAEVIIAWSDVIEFCDSIDCGDFFQYLLTVVDELHDDGAFAIIDWFDKERAVSVECIDLETCLMRI